MVEVGERVAVAILGRGFNLLLGAAFVAVVAVLLGFAADADEVAVEAFER